MLEELSLRNNRGSLLFHKRQRRVQKFTFEFASSPRALVAGSAKEKVTGTAEPGTVSVHRDPEVANSSEGQNYHSELHIFPTSGPGGPEGAQPTAARPVSAHSPSALAPGYAEPLKGVPPEKFNHTAIPKGGSHTHSLLEYRNFNTTPVPFGGRLVGETISRAGTLFVPELTSGLELLRLRPSFNRVAQGWVCNLPESEEL
ncbi:hypothetical protein E2I00_002415 [Balaenoptera physalus]|uniref:Myozenin-3 n=1 Tax=Balaenoptera physalus TaxID=9770 RepID=A0A643C725_BALPH|nr:hypothetical protein E2I00_002415 [Balaenoptera physalus]